MGMKNPAYFLLVLLCLCISIFAVSANAAEGEGTSLFHNKCANCHGNDGGGRTAYATRVRVPDLRSKAIKDLTDQQLYNTIAIGTSHREYPHAYLYKGVTKAQIEDVVAYIRTLQK